MAVRRIDEEFLALFNGKEQIGGAAEGYDRAHKFLKHADGERRALTCLVFYEKPVQFLATGKTKSGEKGDGTAVDKSVLSYLPQHSDDTRPTSRNSLKFGEFSNVNFAMVRRVALLAIEYELLPKKYIDQWKSNYGGSPSEVSFSGGKWSQMNPETWTIKKEGIRKFQMESVYWNALTF